jgi:hypothetical protein
MKRLLATIDESKVEPGMTKYKITEIVTYTRKEYHYVWAVDADQANSLHDDAYMREPAEVGEYEFEDAYRDKTEEDGQCKQGG